ncbi:MAG TPA: M20/M25/M40 family metallo-hydrolase, partial [Gemmatimonadota bacterium]|nr:M20/M25/M40 family metallo-hydrolase [Gemmatimonadota bacterium]
NVASDGPNIRRNADFILAMLRRRGLEARLLEVPGSSPAVYGELRSPGARKTVVLYAHYDGQPVSGSGWESGPWEPVLRDGALEAGGRPIAWPAAGARFDPEWRLYARSASDDKAPIAAVLWALDALRAAGTRPSVNLKLFLDGEEEAGSPHIGTMLEKHRAALAGDLWLLLDGPVHQSRRMQVYFGARGVQDLEITAYGAMRRLHSGHYGNWAPNPAAEIAQVVASLRGPDGSIRVRGLMDDVRPPTESERRAAAESPDVEEALARELGLSATAVSPERAAEGILRPAINVRGIAAGDVGEKATNSIPTVAQASIDFRLVPELTPEKVRRRVEEHLRAEGYHLVSETPDPELRRRHPKILLLEWGPGYPPARTSLDLPESRAVVSAIEGWAGGPIIRLPTLGGSVPMHLFAEKMQVPVIGVPIVNHDNNQHAPNENVRLQNLWDGIEIYAVLFARLGEIWK